MRWVHVLAYFPGGNATPAFHRWLELQREERRDRNRRLAARLQQQNIPVTLEEVEARGKTLAGRPHFARILVEKGFARNHDDAFQRFIGEDAPAFVERQSPRTQELMRIVREGGGIPVIAHPIRVGLPHEQMKPWLSSLKDEGLLGLEVYHSEHNAEMQAAYLLLASELELAPTGGSDFHGTVKPDVALGTGRLNNVDVPYRFLAGLKGLTSVFS